MNALQNMECVKSGRSSLKEQSLVAMGSYLAQLRLTHPQFAAQSDALVEKAKALPDEFFAAVDCEWNVEGKAIAAAVQRA